MILLILPARFGTHLRKNTGSFKSNRFSFTKYGQEGKAQYVHKGRRERTCKRSRGVTRTLYTEKIAKSQFMQR